MDKLTRWSAHLVDLRSLFSLWEARHVPGQRWSQRFREIHSACMFALCMENYSDKRYLIGFPRPIIDNSPVQLDRLFDDDFGKVEDTDILLVDDPKSYEQSTVLHHRCQLMSYIHQPSTTERDWVKFLDERLRRPPDDDLRLVVHVEQEGPVNYEFLFAYLTHWKPRCPYSQVFVFGQTANGPRKWSCAQVFPTLAVMRDLDEETAKALVLDRQQYNKELANSLSQGPSILLQAVVELGPKAAEGRVIQAVAAPWFEIAKLIEKDPAVMYEINSRKWEELIAGWYKSYGFDEVVLTPQSGDLGRDVIAVKYGVLSVRIIDQVKAYAPGRLVPANDVRALLGVLSSDRAATKGLVTTTSDFAPKIETDALIAPYLPTRLELVNGTELVRRLADVANKK